MSSTTEKLKNLKFLKGVKLNIMSLIKKLDKAVSTLTR